MWIDEGSPTREIKVTLSMKDIAGWLDAHVDDLHLTHVDKAPGSDRREQIGAVRICLLWKEQK